MAMPKLNVRNEDLLYAIGNKTRLKILLALWKAEKELTIYQICRLTGFGRSSVDRNIKILLGANLVTKKMYGEISLYTINIWSEELNALIEFFRKTRF